MVDAPSTVPAGAAAAAEPVIAVDEVQGDVLAGTNTRFTELAFFTFSADTPAARRWLGRVADQVTSLREALEDRDRRRQLFRAGAGVEQVRSLGSCSTTVGLSAGGLRRLAPELDPAALDDSFALGLPARSSRLEDPVDPTDDGHPSRWVIGSGPVPEVIVRLDANDAGAIEDAVRGLGDEAVSLVGRQRGERLAGDIEHFGFRDGISQPGPRGRLPAGPAAAATDGFLTRRALAGTALGDRYASPGQPLVWPGQFVFGYPAQSNDDPRGATAAHGPEWAVNGSLLVYRRLRQDVAAFRAFVAQAAGELGREPDRFAGELVGRWPDGSALVRHPAGPPAAPDDRLAENHFGYREAAPSLTVGGSAVPGAPADFLGEVCPRWAHIRKVNPRDLQTDLGPQAVTLTMSVLRRGIPFGPLFDEAPGDERGLHFLCYQTSIEQQFERLTTRWANTASGPEAGGHDLIIGQERSGRGATVRRADGTSTELRAPGRWVTPTGGGYFFVPGRALLGRLTAAS